MISSIDLEQVINRLTGEEQQLSPEDMKQLVTNVSWLADRGGSAF